jgi:hypothetical protein
MNQFKTHWLLFDAIRSAITMCLKFKEEIVNPSSLVNLIDDYSWITFELSLFASNIRREVCNVLDFFLFFKRNFEKKKTHNMLSLMLDPNSKAFI